MEKAPLVSVIIPVYNGSNYIEKSIKSVLNQSYKNFELLIIDDGSNDNKRTKTIINNYIDNNIHYIYKNNGGVSSALNTGIKQSKGKYICWLSHDDEFYSNKIQVQLNYFNENPEIDFIYTDYDFINSSSENIGECICCEESENILNEMLQAMFICGSTIMFKKECTYNNLFNEELRYTQDAEFWIRNIIKKHKFKHVNQKLSKIRLHDSQGSKNKKNMKIGTFNYIDLFLKSAKPNDFFKNINFNSKQNLSIYYLYLSKVLLKRHKYFKKSIQFLNMSIKYKISFYNIIFIPKIILYILLYNIYSFSKFKRIENHSIDFNQFSKSIPLPEFK